METRTTNPQHEVDHLKSVITQLELDNSDLREQVTRLKARIPNARGVLGPRASEMKISANVEAQNKVGKKPQSGSRTADTLGPKSGLRSNPVLVPSASAISANTNAPWGSGRRSPSGPWKSLVPPFSNPKPELPDLATLRERAIKDKAEGRLPQLSVEEQARSARRDRLRKTRMKQHRRSLLERAEVHFDSESDEEDTDEADGKVQRDGISVSEFPEGIHDMSIKEADTPSTKERNGPDGSKDKDHKELEPNSAPPKTTRGAKVTQAEVSIRQQPRPQEDTDEEDGPQRQPAPLPSAAGDPAATSTKGHSSVEPHFEPSQSYSVGSAGESQGEDVRKCKAHLGAFHFRALTLNSHDRCRSPRSAAGSSGRVDDACCPSGNDGDRSGETQTAGGEVRTKGGTQTSGRGRKTMRVEGPSVRKVNKQSHLQTLLP